MDCSPPGSSLHLILQARALEWLPLPSPEDLPNPGIEPSSPALQVDSLLSERPGSWISGYIGQHFCRNQMMFCESWLSFLDGACDLKVTQLCLTLCDPMDYTVHGILRARVLEQVAFPVSRGSSQPRGRTQVSNIAGGFFTS